jgi:hypothetical protein
MTGCLVNDIEKMEKEQILAQFEVLFWSLYGETEKRHENIRTLPLSADIRTGTSRRHKHYCLHYRAWSAANFYTDSIPSISSIK